MNKKRYSSKDKTSYLFNRYMWLVDTIYCAKKISFEALNAKWIRSGLNESGDSLPKKTFHNHKTAIESLFDINIVCDISAGYLYYIENCEEMERGELQTWLLNTLSVKNMITKSQKLKGRILFEQTPGGAFYITPILESMRDGVVLEITYQSYFSHRTNTFLVEPYCLKFFKQRWYVLARSVYEDKLRIYALDRIKNIQSTDEYFALPNEFDAHTYFLESYGIIASDTTKVQKVEIKVYGNQVKYLQSLPLHHSQEAIETSQDYSIFSYWLRPTFDFCQAIYAHASSYEVLSPTWLRDEIRNELKEALGRYQ